MTPYEPQPAEGPPAEGPPAEGPPAEGPPAGGPPSEGQGGEGADRVIPPEERLLRTAALRIAVQFALAVVLLLAVVGAALYTLDRQAARSSAQDVLRQATSGAVADVGHPPAGVLLVTRAADGTVSASPGTPQAAARGGLLGRRTGRSAYTDDAGDSYQLLTRDRPGGVRLQALYANRRGQQERDRLLTALLLSEALGALAALAVGGFLARRAIRPLSDALALQRRFVADASHELRAPLTVLHTRAQLLLRGRRSGKGEPADLVEQLDALVHDSHVLTEIVDDLLTSAELAHRPTGQQVVDLAALAIDVTASFAPTAATHGVHVQASAPAPVLVSGVPTALRRAVSALVDNALAHERTGGTVTVEVVVQTDGRRRTWARLAISDTGVGLDPAAAPELFARFARGGNTPGAGRRFGLGLALVRDVVAAHRGQISVHGAPGHGASFVVLLPVHLPGAAR